MTTKARRIGEKKRPRLGTINGEACIWFVRSIIGSFLLGVGTRVDAVRVGSIRPDLDLRDDARTPGKPHSPLPRRHGFTPPSPGREVQQHCLGGIEAAFVRMGPYGASHCAPVFYSP